MKLPYLSLIRGYLKEAIESGKKKSMDQLTYEFLLSSSFLGFYSKSITGEEKHIYTHYTYVHCQYFSCSHPVVELS